jgi:hypothetical protein
MWINERSTGFRWLEHRSVDSSGFVRGFAVRDSRVLMKNTSNEGECSRSTSTVSQRTFLQGRTQVLSSCERFTGKEESVASFETQERTVSS